MSLFLQSEKTEKEILREEFELVSSNLRAILSKRPEKVNFYEREHLNSLFKKVIFIKESFDLHSANFCRMAQSAELQISKPGAVVFRKGDIGKYFYIVLEGSYCVEIENIRERKKEKNIYYCPGDSFGEVSLIYEVPRGATIIADKQSSLIRIPKVVFNEVGNLHKSITYLNKFFEEHPFFENEDKFMVRVISALSKLVKFKANDVLIEEGTKLNEILFFVKGEAEIFKKLKLISDGAYFEETIQIGKLNAGSVFGENFYLSKEPCSLRVVAKHGFGEFIKVSFKQNVNTVDTPLYKRIRLNALRFPTDEEVLEQYKLHLQQCIEQGKFLKQVYKGKQNAKKGETELAIIKRKWAKIKNAKLA